MEPFPFSATTGKENNSMIDISLIRLIATSQTPVSRTSLAHLTGLSKMTIGKHIASLIQKGLLTEDESYAGTTGSLGRRPAYLRISATSPCICGILLKRTYCQSVLADISGNILDMEKCNLPEDLTADVLTRILLSQYDTLATHTKRPIIGCGISSMGPLNSITGCILNPPNFYGISNYPIVTICREHTGLPTYLIQDANAGALVEKLYGKGVPYDNFMYLHIENGIGLGFVLNGRLFNGFSGQSGEIGHTSININGPKCSCGNTGCLELYANLEQMQKKVAQLLPLFKNSPFHNIKEISWNDILSLAANEEPIAIAALDEFCGYLSHALTNILTLLDFSIIIIGYDSLSHSDMIEKMLRTNLHNYLSSSSSIKIIHSYFNNDAPLLGAISVVANEIFNQNLLIL